MRKGCLKRETKPEQTPSVRTELEFFTGMRKYTHRQAQGRLLAVGAPLFAVVNVDAVVHTW